MVAEIAASVSALPTFSGTVNDPASFDEIYHTAGIDTPAHGYTIKWMTLSGCRAP
jgi:hypothetical protein